MHEISLLQNIFTYLEQIAGQQELRKITKVEIKVGKLRQVVPEFMQFAFEHLAKNTHAEGAELIIEYIPIKMLCAACNKTFIVDENTYVCPYCAEVNLQILSGKELILESVHGEPLKTGEK